MPRAAEEISSDEDEGAEGVSRRLRRGGILARVVGNGLVGRCFAKGMGGDEETRYYQERVQRHREARMRRRRERMMSDASHSLSSTSAGSDPEGGRGGEAKGSGGVGSGGVGWGDGYVTRRRATVLYEMDADGMDAGEAGDAGGGGGEGASAGLEYVYPKVAVWSHYRHMMGRMASRGGVQGGFQAFARLPGSRTRLQCRVTRCNRDSDVGCVILHPHPMLGGRMKNNVVYALRDAFVSMGEFNTVLTYNSRGVGQSTGFGSAAGGAECEDLVKLLDVVATELRGERGEEEGWPLPKRFYVVGYSFGAMVASYAGIHSERVVGYAGISFPMGSLASFMCPFYQKYLLNATVPSLLVIGDADSYTPMRKFKQVVSDCPRSNVHMVVVPGLDHFWHGHEPDAVVPVFAWILKQLAQSQKGGRDCPAAPAPAADAGMSSASMSPKSDKS